MKQIAVITGASSGMGRRCVETCGQMGPFDEVWVIARREDKLEALLACYNYHDSGRCLCQEN